MTTPYYQDDPRRQRGGGVSEIENRGEPLYDAEALKRAGWTEHGGSVSEIVRIMPKEPIEAEPPMFPDAWERPVWCVPDVDGDGVAVPADDWVEVSEYVWDDSEETLAAINAALPVGFSAHRKGCEDLWIRRSGTLWAAQVSPASRVRIEGATFSILPPKDGDA